jgi:hypothetical protein
LTELVALTQHAKEAYEVVAENARAFVAHVVEWREQDSIKETVAIRCRAHAANGGGG